MIIDMQAHVMAPGELYQYKAKQAFNRFRVPSKV